MDYLSQILGDPNLERTVTIKTKPGKGEQAPEAPLDSGSANLPQPVLDLMQMQARAMQPSPQPLQGQTPMDSAFPPAVMQMMNQPAGLRELENAGSYANRLVRREHIRNRNGINGLIEMLLGPSYKGYEAPQPNPYTGPEDAGNPYAPPPMMPVISPNRT